jgi:hypothetical protein
MKIVKFNQRYESYNPGETAGFADSVADELCRRSVAVPVVDGKPVFQAKSKPVTAAKPGQAKAKGQAKPAPASLVTTPYPATEDDVELLASRGYLVKTIEDASLFVTGLSEKDRPGYDAELADWKASQSSGTGT